MDYQKKVLVLKQVVSGFSLGEKPVNAIARIECENGVSEFHLTIINLAPVSGGNYYAFVLDSENNLYEFELGTRPLSFFKEFNCFPDISNGYSAGICFIQNSLPTLIAFAKSSNTADATLFKKKVAEHCMVKLKSAKPSNTIEQTTISFNRPVVSPVYDDEAVATENYFETEEKIKLKIEKIEEFNRERIPLKDELFNSSSAQETQKSQEDSSCVQNEAFVDFGKNQHARLSYYSKVKDELENLFDKFESLSELCQVFPESKWAKINYDKERFYAVGVIKKQGVEKYVCYGVPDSNDKEPPKELQGYCSFIHTNDALLPYKGYWMMFQDAENGKCIKQF